MGRLAGIRFRPPASYHPAMGRAWWLLAAAACTPASGPSVEIAGVGGGSGGEPPVDDRVRWSLRAGGQDSDGVAAASALVGVAVTGWFHGSIEIAGVPLESAGGADGFVAVLDNDGRYVWSRRFGGPGDDRGTAVVVDLAGFVMVAGTFEGAVDVGTGTELVADGASDIVVARFDNQGMPLWAHRVGDSDDTETAGAIGVSLDCSTTIAGGFRGTLDTGTGPIASAGGSDGFVARFDAEGVPVWSHAMGGAGDDALQALSVGLTATIVAGVSEGNVSVSALDPDGLPVWTTSHAPGVPYAVVRSWSDATFVAGANDDGAFVAQLDTAGDAVWARILGATARVNALAVGDDDDVLAVGTFRGALDDRQGAGGDDAFAVLLDASGSLRWSRAFGDAADQRATGAAFVGPAPLVAGSMAGTVGDMTSAGSDDVFVVALDP
jgi:hypothetical protein